MGGGDFNLGGREGGGAEAFLGSRSVCRGPFCMSWMWERSRLDSFVREGVSAMVSGESLVQDALASLTVFWPRLFFFLNFLGRCLACSLHSLEGEIEGSVDLAGVLEIIVLSLSDHLRVIGGMSEAGKVCPSCVSSSGMEGGNLVASSRRSVPLFQAFLSAV